MASSATIEDEISRSEEIRAPDRIEEGNDRDLDLDEVGVSYSSCGCFFGFGSRLSRSSSVRCRYLLLRENEEVKQSWMMKKVKRFKDIIKAMAGRKWRSFINGIVNKRRSVRFQYDPRSYALNFDEGMGEEEGGGGRHGFRQPFASPIG
ncbi:uncharacterized protein LOC111492425 [Cucurbita maxima]|uniref:Uncharacterized protein LOC111492425 n=1 Tax=Cucurbita maxima TaxID=3661 RepID=A0A6J1K5B0_CUCMA|nr:uncharacterized protein LOC111492425 [Cucurbita maxima]